MLTSAIGQDYNGAPGTNLESTSTVGLRHDWEGVRQGIGERGALRWGQGWGALTQAAPAFLQPLAQW